MPPARDEVDDGTSTTWKAHRWSDIRPALLMLVSSSRYHVLKVDVSSSFSSLKVPRRYWATTLRAGIRAQFSCRRP